MRLSKHMNKTYADMSKYIYMSIKYKSAQVEMNNNPEFHLWFTFMSFVPFLQATWKWKRCQHHIPCVVHSHPRASAKTGANGYHWEAIHATKRFVHVFACSWFPFPFYSLICCLMFDARCLIVHSTVWMSYSGFLSWLSFVLLQNIIDDRISSGENECSWIGWSRGGRRMQCIDMI